MAIVHDETEIKLNQLNKRNCTRQYSPQEDHASRKPTVALSAEDVQAMIEDDVSMIEEKKNARNATVLLNVEDIEKIRQLIDNSQQADDEFSDVPTPNNSMSATVQSIPQPMIKPFEKKSFSSLTTASEHLQFQDNEEYELSNEDLDDSVFFNNRSNFNNFQMNHQQDSTEELYTPTPQDIFLKFIAFGLPIFSMITSFIILILD